MGGAVLDLSKLNMYKLHYDIVKPLWNDKTKLLFTDTDSLCYRIETKDIYKDITALVPTQFDTSGYPKNHPSGIPTGMNKKVLSMFKDEAGGKQITEFVGLRAKLYSFLVEGEDPHMKQKITHQDYLDCLQTKFPKYVTFNNIRSRKHRITTETMLEKALSADDDKRVILEDGINTLAYGHYKLKN